MRSWCVRFSLDIDVSVLFIRCLTHLPSHSFHFLTLKLVEYLCTLPKKVWPPLTRPTPSQVMSPTPTTSRRLTSSPTQSSWPRRRSSQSKGFPRTPSTMTPHSWMCCVKLTEYMSITHNEKTCLSVSRRRVSERTGRPVGEGAGRPAESSSQDAQIRTLLDRQKEQNFRRVSGGN